MHVEPWLSIETRRDVDGCLVIRLIGELDMSTASDVAAELSAILRSDGPADIIVDLGELTFMDAAGVTALLDAHQRAAATGRTLRAREPHGEVDTVLRVTGTADLLQIPGIPVSDHPEPDRPRRLMT